MKRNFYWINLIGRFFCFFLLAFFSFQPNAYPAYTDYLDTVQKVYIGYYQRPADPGGLIYWAAKLDARAGNLNEIIAAFANSAESQTLYGTIDSSTIGNVVDSIYNALFCRDAEAGGKAYYVDGFAAGTFTAATIMLNILNGAQNEDLLSINNKLTAANLFTRTIDPELDGREYQATYSGDADAQKGREFLSTVCWDPATIPIPFYYHPIEGNVIFSIQEGYQDHDSISEPSIMLSMATEEIYGCCNYSIISKITVQSNKISIDFLGIYVPEICLTAFGPAGSTSFLDISNGEYPLYFSSYRSGTDRYILTVTDSSIKITEDLSQFTKPELKLFWRYPPNSFAYLCGTTTETSWICEDFLDTLLSEIDLEEFQFPDSGEIPYPRSSMGHDYDMPAKYFFYERDEDFDKAGVILKSYTQNVIVQYSGKWLPFGISLISWKNKKHLSWTFEIELTENITTPTTPSGSTSGNTGTSYSYTTGGSTSSYGHSVEYQFDWKGDESDLSSWGSATQSKTWTAAGTYNVRARARCTLHNSVISDWSGSIQVVIAFDQLVWVSQSYVGGIQCDPTTIYTPPDVRIVLGSAGIEVYDTTIEFGLVCAACGCPTYAAMHYALISDADLAKAQELGFQ